MKQLTLALFFITFLSCKTEVNKKSVLLSEVIPQETIVEDDIAIPVYRGFETFEPFLHQSDDKIYVINFWATWCKPCVEELPYFETINKEYNKKNVQVILVSLDMPKMIEKQLIPFVKNRKLQSTVVVLDDPKHNNWIPKVNKKWDGAIPATVIYTKNKRMFYEKQFTYTELEKEVKQFIKN